MTTESDLDHIEWLKKELARAMASGKSNRATQIQKDITRYQQKLGVDVNGK